MGSQGWQFFSVPLLPVISVLIFWEMIETLDSFDMEIYYHLPNKETGKSKLNQKYSVPYNLLPDYDVYIDIYAYISW